MKIKEFRHKSIVAQLWKEELTDSCEPCVRLSFSRIQKVKDGSGNTYVRDGFRPEEIKDVARLIKTVHKWLKCKWQTFFPAISEDNFPSSECKKMAIPPFL